MGLSFENATYDECCGCVMIALTTTEIQELEFAEKRGDREQFMRKMFSKTGRDRTYDADCKTCDYGMKRSKDGSIY